MFEQGGDPKWCWCQYFRKAGLTWSNSSAADNRNDLAALADRNPAPGLVAYDNGRAVGWVGLAPRVAYERLSNAKLLAPIDDQPVWSIVCFVVSRKSRGQGIARALLRSAIDFARDHGAQILEAYPVARDHGKVSAASAYKGTESMFEREGFAVVEVRQWNNASPPRPIMRLELA